MRKGALNVLLLVPVTVIMLTNIIWNKTLLKTYKEMRKERNDTYRWLVVISVIINGILRMYGYLVSLKKEKNVLNVIQGNLFLLRVLVL